jgi:hypothetical protein
MTRDEVARELERFASRRPFRPFSIELNSSTRFQLDVANSLTFRDRAGVALLPGGRRVIFEFDEVSRIIDDSAMDCC